MINVKKTSLMTKLLIIDNISMIKIYEEIILEYESDESQYYDDEALEQERKLAQNQFVKDH